MEQALRQVRELPFLCVQHQEDAELKLVINNKKVAFHNAVKRTLRNISNTVQVLRPVTNILEWDIPSEITQFTVDIGGFSSDEFKTWREGNRLYGEGREITIQPGEEINIIISTIEHKALKDVYYQHNHYPTMNPQVNFRSEIPGINIAIGFAALGDTEDTAGRTNKITRGYAGVLLPYQSIEFLWW